MAGPRWGRLWNWLTAAPDEALADAARDGELVVARVRTWLTLLLTLSPLFSLVLEPAPQHYIGLAVAFLAVTVAVIMERAIQRGIYRPGISFVSAIADVTLVTVALALFWVIGDPIVAVNSRVIFECYFIAIAASALRYDPRVTLAAGLMAMTQHAVLTVGVWAAHRRDGLLRASDAYGEFSWATQVSRTIVLLGMTVIALAIVARTQRLRRMSTADRLTGLFNRLYAEEFLANEVLRTARTRSHLVIALLDVDHFKQFNDTHGHAAGDAALRRMSEVLRGALRRSDVVARFGGEEVLIILPGTDLASAMEKLDEVRVTIGLSEVTLPRGGTARMQVSIGVAAWGLDARTVDALLEIADARLYEAKHAGRNRVVGPNV